MTAGFICFGLVHPPWDWWWVEVGVGVDLLVDLTGYMWHFGMTGLSCQTYAATAVGW